MAPLRTDVRIAREREKFLSDGTPARHLRTDIGMSWQRCREWGVPIDSSPRFVGLITPDSALLRAAAPVLDRITEGLGELGISFIIADSDARVVDRRVLTDRLEKRLDAMNVSPGFVMSEDLVGTNGLGTPLEAGQTVRVDGHEHFAEGLLDFTCVGVPLTDWITGRTVGVLDVTSVVDRDNATITLLARQTARAIEQQLHERRSHRERALLEQFLKASNTRSGVVALGERILIANPAASRLLHGIDQPSIRDHAARSLAGQEQANTVTLSDGTSIEATVVPVREGQEILGAMVTVRPSARPAVAAHPRGRLPPIDRTGMVGTHPVLLTAYQEARDTPPGIALVLRGEPGAGKSTLARAIYGARSNRDPITFDMAEEPTSIALLSRVRGLVWSSSPQAVLLQHVDVLEDRVIPFLAVVVGEALDSGWQVATTVSGAGRLAADTLPGVRSSEVHVPSLRTRRSDIPAIAAAIAAPARLDGEAAQLLMRLTWPGNVRELRAVVEGMRSHADGRALSLSDIPMDVRARAPRRTLSRLEQAELNTIVEALTESGGNKKKAAELLGLSRSTLYRRLQPYGIDLENTLY